MPLYMHVREIFCGLNRQPGLGKACDGEQQCPSDAAWAQ